MHSKTLLAVLAFATAVAAAPIPSDSLGGLENIFGSAVGSFGGNGNGNVVGNDNGGNVDGDGNGSGSNDGNSNISGSGNSALSIGKLEDLSNVFGNALGSLNDNANGNSAGKQ